MELNFELKSSMLLERAGLDPQGLEAKISRVVTLENLQSNSLLFSKGINDSLVQRLSSLKGCIMVLPKGADASPLVDRLKVSNCLVFSDTPRMTFAKLLEIVEQKIVEEMNGLSYSNVNGATIGERTTIGCDTIIEPGAFVDHNVTIGSSCVIRSGARVRSRVQIEDNVIIRENTVVGGPGFGVEKDEDGHNIRIPHLGGVIIKSNVEIGALNTVVSGTIEPTIIDEYVKTDDHVHIAHNCQVGRNTNITACVEISGSVRIGENCMIGPNASVMNGIIIGKNSVIGLGAVITKSIEDSSIVAGNPAESIEIVKLQRRAIKKLVQNLLKESDKQ